MAERQMEKFDMTDVNELLSYAWNRAIIDGDERASRFIQDALALRTEMSGLNLPREAAGMNVRFGPSAEQKAEHIEAAGKTIDDTLGNTACPVCGDICPAAGCPKCGTMFETMSKEDAYKID